MSVEVVEARYPIRIESAGLVPDSGGAGGRRGGLGTFREYRLLAGGHASSAAESGGPGPFGGNGGAPGGAPRRGAGEGPVVGNGYWKTRQKLGETNVFFETCQFYLIELFF